MRIDLSKVASAVASKVVKVKLAKWVSRQRRLNKKFQPPSLKTGVEPCEFNFSKLASVASEVVKVELAKEVSRQRRLNKKFQPPD